MNAMSAMPQPLVSPQQDLLRRPLRDLRLSVIDACNFRCPYCMPASRIGNDHGMDASQRLSFDAIETLVRGFARLGVRKLRITGGEPLLRKDLPVLIGRLARIDGIDDLAMTTNGALLARHAHALRDAGLHRLTVSMDALDPAIFHTLSGGRCDIGQVLDGLVAAQDAGFSAIKLNCVVQLGVNDGEILPLTEFARAHGHTMRFIEYMDVGTCNGWDRARVLPSARVRDRIHARWPLRALQPRYRGEVAARYGFIDGQGEVGLISSVSQPFCGDCQRARVSADGRLFTCLFASEGADLRAALAQGDETLAVQVAALWTRRADRYSELRDALPTRRHVEMFLIGG